MNPPKVIYVGPTDIDVTFTKALSSPTQVGAFDSMGTEITLKRKQSAACLRDTVMHELVHALLFQSGAGQLLELSEETEERLVQILSPWVLALLRDNPALVEFLLENREREY